VTPESGGDWRSCGGWGLISIAARSGVHRSKGIGGEDGCPVGDGGGLGVGEQHNTATKVLMAPTGSEGGRRGSSAWRRSTQETRWWRCRHGAHLSFTRWRSLTRGGRAPCEGA
jgi:hypothetical protein